MRFNRDRRTPLEQAKSGLRIVGAMVATLATISLFALAYTEIANADHTRSPLAGWLLVIALTATLGITLQYWRRWFFCLPGYLGIRSSLWLLLGWFSLRGFVYVGFPVLMFAMFGMSLRFSESAKLRTFDRAILLITAACLLGAMLAFFSQPSVTALLFAAIGDLALLTSRFYPTGKSRRRAAHDPPPLTLNRCPPYAPTASCPPNGKKYCVPLIGSVTFRNSSCKSSLRSTKSISDVFTISRSDDV